MKTIDSDFKKSTYSQYGDGNRIHCVEVKRCENEILVRDSKNKKGAVLSFTQPEWEAFLKGVKNSEFDV